MSKNFFVEKTSSKGVVICKAFVIEKADLSPATYSPSDKEGEIAKFEKALAESKEEIAVLCESSDIFQGHSMILEDPSLYDSVLDKIKDDNQNVEVAVSSSIEQIASIFSMMEDEYMKERSADVKDIGARIMSKIKGVSINPFEAIKEEVIIIADDLTPSDTALIDLNYVKGFVTELGGVTSHVSIIARSLKLPALVGVSGIMEGVKTGDILAMDASKGDIVVNPEDSDIEKFNKLKEEFEKAEELLKEIEHLDAETTDGHRVYLCANVGSLTDVENAVKTNIDGIGLFRSEILYMDNTQFPTEDEQFEVYKKSAELCNGKEVTIRTLDIGGDKSLPYYEFEFEENPFLGWRAIRICLDMPEVFEAQLKAILRASAFGYVRIMYPMIISVEELIASNEILEKCKQDLRDANVAFDEKIEVGMMIETPASVILAEEFSKHVDFFSIGTNDLTQYMLVVDRGNKKIANMYDSFHPVVLRSIKTVIDAGHKHNTKVGMCGEFASDAKAAKILLGLGLDEFSMSATEINTVKKQIRESNYAEVKEFAEKAIAHSTIKEIMDFIDNN
ncbi:MAG: phosphoenolpyruvate--protein phosphotransferase [bacterium]